MYSSVNNHDTSSSILSLKEIFAVIVVFAFVLYLLFPKGDIELLLEEGEKHTNLSINYLESMLLYHPDNTKLKMMLVKKYDHIGEFQKALALNQELLQTIHDKETLIQLYKTQYLLEKTNYFKTGDKRLLPRLKKRLLDYYNYTKEQRDILFFYAETTNIDYDYLKYHSLKDLMQEQPSMIDYELQKIRFYLAEKLGYKEDAYRQLIDLLNYPEIESQLQEYAIASLISHHEYERAATITQNLMLNAFESAEIVKYFQLALYSLSQNKERKKGAITALVRSYVSVKELNSDDIYMVINKLLQNSELKESAHFAYQLFNEMAEKFDEKSIELVMNILTYDSQLDKALEVSSFAYNKYHQQKYLDKTIQFSLWSGRVKEATTLNIEGYQTYAERKYERYLLQHTSLDDGYEILGKIYQQRVTKGDYAFVNKLSTYFHYTGEMEKAETFFTQALAKHPQKALHAAAVNFSFDNSHFEKAFSLYEAYTSLYGIDKELQTKTIKRLIAGKKFKQAYRLTKELHQEKKLKEKRFLVDLSWYHKDYHYLHKALWHDEKYAKLNSTGYERLIFLERGLTDCKRVSYLYQQAWEKTQRNDYLLALFYDLFEKKRFQTFGHYIETLTPAQKIQFEKDINYNILLANYYIQTQQLNLALNFFNKALELSPNRVETHQSYLWFLLDNYAKNSMLKENIVTELALLENNPTLQESVGIPAVMAAMLLKKYQLASRWNRALLKANPFNSEYRQVSRDLALTEQTKLYESYDKMLNNSYLNGQVSLTKNHLSEITNVKESNVAYEWKLYKNINSKLSLTHYEYQNSNQANSEETSLEFALRNTQEQFLWDIKVASHSATNDYLSASLNLGYQLSSFTINLESKYQNKTTLTPQLEQNGLESGVSIALTDALSRRISVGLLYKKSHFESQQGEALGTAETTQLSANYILRSGYPDISFNTYLNHNDFTNNIANDFSEFGIASSIGTARQYTLNRTWKPFASLGFAINDQRNIGSSLSLGLSKTLRGEDSLDFLFNYSKGIGVISEPIYGMELKYRF